MLQARPPPGLPSSIMPLQLSSTPLQTSTCGGSGVHGLGFPLLHDGTALKHAPTPQVTLPSPSSTRPLQSLSTPSQISGDGRPGVQVWTTPPTQFVEVTWQAPTPHTVVPRPSSTRPLQSSSLPLQTSATGRVSPWHAPHMPPWQGWVPGLHVPTPWVAGAPV